jgi:hypothetical protein
MDVLGTADPRSTFDDDEDIALLRPNLELFDYCKWVVK